jgi:hypothetical protein
MKSIWLWNLLILLGSDASFAYNPDLTSEKLLIGKWQFSGYIYGGQLLPPPNPNLVLTFQFFDDGTDLLHWHRVNEEGLCERKGRFSYNGDQLTDKVIWINPENSFECDRDPDMVLGKTQVTPLKRIDDRLHMDLPLSEETITYIWAPVSETPTQVDQQNLGY